jgi:solute carrier family 25 2-oxodicarboxylate transporter 21
MSKTECIHIASGISGIFEVLISHPLDRIKTELQIMTLNNVNKNQISSNPNIISGITTIYKNNKLKGFYSGILPRLTGIIPMRLIYWSTMTYTTDYININHTKINNLFNNYLTNDISNFTINLIPGLITGLTQSIIDNPIEVAKIKLMTGTYNFKLSNIYQGFSYLVARNIIFAIPVAYSIKKYGKDNPFFAGAIGGIMGSFLSHPLDVIKTERQRHKTDKTKKITLLNMILTNPKSLMSGLIMRTTLSFVNMGIGFMVFNYIYNELYQV